MLTNRPPMLRCLAVWASVTGAVVAAGALAGPTAHAPADPAFEAGLVRACSWLLLGCLGWLWVGATAVLVAATRGRGAGSGWLPAPVRRGLLAAAGVAVLASGPAAADPGTPPTGPVPPGPADVLDGLPLPERPHGRPSSVAEAHRAVHVVRPGDTLWAIAARTLPAGAGSADVDAYWRRVHARNRGVLGPDPDLIHPGQRLVLPPA